MKIALVILYADPARGGAERYTVDLAAALARGWHEVTLISGASCPQGTNTLFVPGEPYRQVLLNAGGLTRTRRYQAFLGSLDRHLAEEAYDIVHAMLPVRKCDVYHPHAGMAAEAVGKWNTLFNPRRRLMAATERQLLAGPNPPTVIALSEYVKRSIRAHYPLPDQRLATLFNAVDLERFQAGTREPRESQEAVNALMIANDFERKGLRQTLKALARVNDARLRLDVVGKQDFQSYARLARELGVEDRVAFRGATSNPHPHYAAADFLVLPTRHDPCSLVVLEALAMGLPVISTVFNGATEIMADGVHGQILSDPDNIDALAAAMRRLLDSGQRERMSQACLALRPRLAYGKHLEQLLGIYQQAKAGRSGT